jgi:DNA-binding LacI/PurR family transcriptional regulator
VNAKRVTMQDVANRAKVSKSSVSLAFNDSSKLSENTVKEILAAARELGYSQDPAGRMLRTRRTNSLGLLLPQQLDRVLENPYYSHFLQGVGTTCYREGFTLLLAPPLRGSMLKSIPYAAVDGFIVSGLENDRGEVNALRQRGIPFVLVDSELRDDVPSVEIDDGAGMRQLVEHLLDLGHRRFGFLALETGIEGGPLKWRGPMLRRITGVVQALRGVGLTLDSDGVTVLEVPCTREGGARGFKELNARDNPPTAIVAFSDIIALGVLDAARAASVMVPEQLSVTGFDDLAESAWGAPALTTVRQPIETKGRLAAEFLVESIASGVGERVHHQQLHTSLLVRTSSGPVPR